MSINFLASTSENSCYIKFVSYHSFYWCVNSQPKRIRRYTLLKYFVGGFASHIGCYKTDHIFISNILPPKNLSQMLSEIVNLAFYTHPYVPVSFPFIFEGRHFLLQPLDENASYWFCGVFTSFLIS